MQLRFFFFKWKTLLNNASTSLSDNFQSIVVECTCMESFEKSINNLIWPEPFLEFSGQLNESINNLPEPFLEFSRQSALCSAGYVGIKSQDYPARDFVIILFPPEDVP